MFKVTADQQPKGSKRQFIGLVFTLRKQIFQAQKIGSCSIQLKKACHF